MLASAASSPGAIAGRFVVGSSDDIVGVWSVGGGVEVFGVVADAQTSSSNQRERWLVHLGP